ncbi:glycosyltransferase family 4 protein [Vibrio vulnificus]|nr:glycosyltransferase family 4 protein [Vibrio vulnificus]RZR38730.1 glycosyltransferase [Vibrio vulnificus]HAS8110980.1 glycosyltransferase [Vibrio vulnificus]HAS8160481.1 glycosyltransferase [Vibrio vulnificus]
MKRRKDIEVDITAVRDQGVFSFIAYIYKSKYSLLHSHHTKAHLYNLIAKLLFGHGCVISLHSEFSRLSIFNKVIVFFCFTLCDSIIANSENTWKTYPKIFKRFRKKRTVIYNGIDISSWSKKVNNRSRDESTNSPRSIRVAMVGRLVDAKNYNFIVSVLKKYKLDGFIFDIYGDGKLKRNLEDVININSLENKIFLKGEVTREYLFSELAHYDLFVNCSVSEGFCNALFESMYVGLPSICPNIPVFSELLPEEYPYLYESSSIDSFYNILTKSVEDKVYYCPNWSKYVENKFDIDKIAGQVITLYLSVGHKYA